MIHIVGLVFVGFVIVMSGIGWYLHRKAKQKAKLQIQRALMYDTMGSDM